MRALAAWSCAEQWKALGMLHSMRAAEEDCGAMLSSNLKDCHVGRGRGNFLCGSRKGLAPRH